MGSLQSSLSYGKLGIEKRAISGEGISDPVHSVALFPFAPDGVNCTGLDVCLFAFQPLIPEMEAGWKYGAKTDPNLQWQGGNVGTN